MARLRTLIAIDGAEDGLDPQLRRQGLLEGDALAHLVTLNERGLREYLVVHGRARIEEGGARG